MEGVTGADTYWSRFVMMYGPSGSSPPSSSPVLPPSPLPESSVSVPVSSGVSFSVSSSGFVSSSGAVAGSGSSGAAVGCGSSSGGSSSVSSSESSEAVKPSVRSVDRASGCSCAGSSARSSGGSVRPTPLTAKTQPNRSAAVSRSPRARANMLSFNRFGSFHRSRAGAFFVRHGKKVYCGRNA